jgi:crotonobetainyl-CoA:carnitine CoA-transferase CaiB-like acyl-CoA transferase
MLRVGTASAIDSLREIFNADEVTKEMIVEKVSGMTRDEAVDFFVESSIPAAPVYQVDEVVKDPHLLARDMIIEMDDPKIGKVKLINFPIKFSEMPCKPETTAPELGQDNYEILSELGYSDELISELQRKGVISYK